MQAGTRLAIHIERRDWSTGGAACVCGRYFSVLIDTKMIRSAEGMALMHSQMYRHL